MADFLQDFTKPDIIASKTIISYEHNFVKEKLKMRSLFIHFLFERRDAIYRGKPEDVQPFRFLQSYLFMFNLNGWS